MARSHILCLSGLLLAGSIRLEAQQITAHDSAMHFFQVRSNVDYNSARWQVALDSAMMIDSTVATLWQWKGMPYFKDGDYANAFRCYEKAVYYDSVNYLPLRAFMKAIFLKDYESAIAEFFTCKERHFGDGLMDHSYDFFLALSYKETGDLAKADSFLSLSIDHRIQTVGPDWVHWNEWFFMGMICFDRKEYTKAIGYYDKCLKEYKGYPNALYYKGLCMAETGRKAIARELFETAITNINKGLRSSEDNDFYVNFPNNVFVADVEAAIQAL